MLLKAKYPIATPVPDSSQYHFARLVLLAPKPPLKDDTCRVLKLKAPFLAKNKFFKTFPDIFYIFSQPNSSKLKVAKIFQYKF